MDCEKIASVSRSDDQREGNIADRTRYNKFKKLKHENNTKRGRKCCSNQHTDLLPNEILCQIFSYLNIKDRLLIERVCARWREVSISSWNISVLTTTMSFTKKKLKLSALLNVLKRCNLSLRKLEIDFSGLWLKRFPKEVCSYCPNLKSITVCGTYNGITTENAKAMVKGWKNLTEISLPRAEISEECLCLLFTSYNIEHLDLTDTKIVGDSFCLLKDCLKSLILNNCNDITPDNLTYIANLHGIRNLQLGGWQSLDESILISVVKSLQESLVELNLGGYFEDTMDDGDSQTFSEVVSYCQNIQSLYLADNDFIDDDVVSVISDTCLQLRVLDLSSTDVMNDGLCNLSVLPRLQHLCLNENDFISKDGIRGISESQSLERIELRESELIENEDIVYLAKNCRTLKELNISKCMRITPNKLLEDLLVQLPREEGYKLDVIAQDYVISRLVCENSEMVLHQICNKP